MIDQRAMFYIDRSSLFIHITQLNAQIYTQHTYQMDQLIVQRCAYESKRRERHSAPEITDDCQLCTVPVPHLRVVPYLTVSCRGKRLLRVSVFVRVHQNGKRRVT